MSASSNALATLDDSTDLLPLDVRPDYLPAKVDNTGIEALGKDDYKTPRIILLQGLNPELTTFKGHAFAGNFWHTGMNVDLGTEFNFVPAVVNKRVILFRPRSDGDGGILAFSRNGKTWDSGANQTFKIKLKGKKEAVSWSTGKDVLSSRLTEFGSSDPDEAKSAPAATTIYEYLCYLPRHPELSPCVLGVSKTALPNGKGLNTSLAMLAKQGIPISCVSVRCFVEEMSNNDGNWTVPNFKLMGKVQKAIYEKVKAIADEFADYKVEYQQEEAATKDSIVDDEIQY